MQNCVPDIFEPPKTAGSAVGYNTTGCITPATLQQAGCITTGCGAIWDGVPCCCATCCGAACRGAACRGAACCAAACCGVALCCWVCYDAAGCSDNLLQSQPVVVSPVGCSMFCCVECHCAVRDVDFVLLIFFQTASPGFRWRKWSSDIFRKGDFWYFEKFQAQTDFKILKSQKAP